MVSEGLVVRRTKGKTKVMAHLSFGLACAGWTVGPMVSAFLVGWAGWLWAGVLPISIMGASVLLGLWAKREGRSDPIEAGEEGLLSAGLILARTYLRVVALAGLAWGVLTMMGPAYS